MASAASDFAPSNYPYGSELDAALWGSWVSEDALSISSGYVAYATWDDGSFSVFGTVSSLSSDVSLDVDFEFSSSDVELESSDVLLVSSSSFVVFSSELVVVFYSVMLADTINLGS